MIALAATIALGACAAESEPDAKPAARPLIRLTTGPPAGGFYPLGEQIARVFNDGVSGVQLKTIASSGAIGNIEAIQRGEAELGLTFADVAYIGFSGRLDEGTPPFNNLRAIAVLQVTPISLVARGDSPISTPADLRGRSVSLGPPRSGTALTANLVLQAYGLDGSSAHVELLGFQDATERLLNGTLDAMFDNAINQSDSVRMAIEGGARFIPIDGPPVEHLRRDYPFFRLAVIPREMYPGTSAPVHTIGVDGVLICRRDLDDELVYEVTKQFFAALPKLSVDGALRLMDVAEAPSTPIPLHNGAARYYRERELMR
jgi:TRAP transporter TAXI family solute receptor